MTLPSAVLPAAAQVSALVSAPKLQCAQPIVRVHSPALAGAAFFSPPSSARTAVETTNARTNGTANNNAFFIATLLKFGSSVEDSSAQTFRYPIVASTTVMSHEEDFVL